MQVTWFFAVQINEFPASIRLMGIPTKQWKPKVGEIFGDGLIACDRNQEFVVRKVFTPKEAQFLEELNELEKIIRTDYFQDGLGEIISLCVNAALDTRASSA